MPVKPDVLDEWLKPQCSRLMYGRCTTLYCLKRGGYTGEPADASIATCEAYEAYNALSQQNVAATSMRDKCVEKVKARRSEKQIEAEARRDPDNPLDYRGSYGLAVGAVDVCDDILADISSLTLEPEKQK